MEEKRIYIEDDIHHRFEVVDKWPQNYLIWNIGYDAIPGYVPFCQLASHQPFFNENTLKAYKTDAYKEIMIAAFVSCSLTLEDMKKYLQRCQKNKKLTSWDRKYVPKLERAIEEIERILNKEKTR